MYHFYYCWVFLKPLFYIAIVRNCLQNFYDIQIFIVFYRTFASGEGSSAAFDFMYFSTEMGILLMSLFRV